jgi:hypothetical protein
VELIVTVHSHGNKHIALLHLEHLHLERLLLRLNAPMCATRLNRPTK